MTSEEPGAPRPVLRNLRPILAAHLPGLSDAALDSLAVECGKELELRAGNQLTAALSPEQDAELERLIDDPDQAKLDEWYEEWYEINRPHVQVVVAKVNAKLIAETVTTVTSAIPDSAVGDRLLTEMCPLSLQMIDEQMRHCGVGATRTQDNGISGSLPLAGGQEISITVRLIDQDVLEIFGRIDDLEFHESERDLLTDLTAHWNIVKRLPRSQVGRGRGPGRFRVNGEVLLPMPALVPRDYISAIVKQVTEAYIALFEDVLRFRSEPPSGD